MGKERLTVKNFGPINELDIEIRPLTMFVGTQGSGKSTVSKLLTICRDIRWWVQIVNGENFMKPFVDFGINEYFQSDSSFSYKFDDFEINFEINFEKGLPSFNSKSIQDNKTIIHVLNTIIAESSDSFLEKTGLRESLSDPLTQNLLNANYRFGLYILAERNLVGNLSDSLASIMLHKIPLSNPLLEYMSMFEKAKNEFSSYDIPFFGVRFIIKDGKEKIELQNKDKHLSLSACSSGLQSALPMLMVIDYALKTQCFNYFVVEEPEQNLFPENQREILSFISKRLFLKKNRFVLTTHSPYLLSCLNVLMLAYKTQHIEIVRNEAEKIIDPSVSVNPDYVAVYSLTPNSKDYCRSLISEKTGLISVNELDSISADIGEDFNRLMQLYVKTLKK